MIDPIAYIDHPPTLRHFFKRGGWREWLTAYPEMFRFIESDLPNQAEYGWHFRESLTAVALFETKGLFSYVEKYHRLIDQDSEQSLPPSLKALFENPPFDSGQFPDLLVRNGDGSRWDFIEVKRKSEQFTDAQQVAFPLIEERTGGTIKIVRVRERTGLASDGWEVHWLSPLFG